MVPVNPVLPSCPETPLGLLDAQFGVGQPQYRVLKVLLSPEDNGRVTSRWRLSWLERIDILLGGSLWVQVLTFGDAIQPIKLLTEEPTPEDCA